jgi:acylphosphatase
MNYGKSSHGSNINQKKSNIFYFTLSKNIASRPYLWLHPAVPTAGNQSKRERMTVYYSGRVQGVGFRYAAKKTAAGFEVVGTIRNLTDGRVELIVEGGRAELEEFRSAIRDAGLAGFIQDERVEWSNAQNTFRNFEISRQ